MTDNTILSLLLLAGATFVVLFVLSFKTYTIPLESFIDQFAGMKRSDFVDVTVRTPKWKILKYKSFPIDTVQCIDKKGNPHTLKKSPSLELRITDKNSKRTVFYFDTIFVSDTEISGDRSRFMGMPATISLANITRIEIQDGKKRFRYVN